MEIKSYLASGAEITPIGATMDSTYGGHYSTHTSASNCIDGDTGTMCSNNVVSGGWLEIDLGSTSRVFLIEVYNRQVGVHVCHSKRAQVTDDIVPNFRIDTEPSRPN